MAACYQQIINEIMAASSGINGVISYATASSGGENRIACDTRSSAYQQ